MRFTALHKALGLPPGPITEAMLEAVISRGTEETDDLDWKDRLPEQKSLATSDYLKDVAAMANIGGGVIVYGIDEEQKAATGRRDIADWSEGRERALKAVAISGISPPVFGLQFQCVGTEPARAVVMVVPATEDGPHLIFRDQYFGAPTRNGADTVWMRERQIETMYRARFEARRASRKELKDLYDEAKSSAYVTTKDWAWFVGVARPRLPSSKVVRRSRQDAVDLLSRSYTTAVMLADADQQRVQAVHPFEVVRRSDPRPGLRRWVAGPIESSSNDGGRHEAWITVHDDGAVSVVASLSGHRAAKGDGVNGWNTVNTATLECAVADLLALTRKQAADLGTSDFDLMFKVEHESDTNLLEFVRAPGLAIESHRIAEFHPVVGWIQADADAEEFQRLSHDLVTDAVNEAGSQGPRLVAKPPAPLK